MARPRKNEGEALKNIVIRFLKQYQKKWEKYCDVADREGMPNMKTYYSKRVKAAELIISILSNNS